LTKIISDVLVIGADGFLGRELQPRLKKIFKFHVYLLDINYSDELSSASLDQFLRIPAINQLEEIFLLRSRQEQFGTDVKRHLVIVNLSGVSRKGKFKSPLDESIKFVKNTEISVRICNFISYLFVRNFYDYVDLVHLSTNGVTLDREPRAYEKSKVAQEVAFRGFFSNLDCGDAQCEMIRLCDVYGSDEDHKDKVINSIIECAKIEKRLPFVTDGAMLFPIHIDFVIDFLCQRFESIIAAKSDSHLTCTDHIKVVSLVPKYSYKIRQVDDFVGKLISHKKISLFTRFWYSVSGRILSLIHIHWSRKSSNAWYSLFLKENSEIEFFRDKQSLLGYIETKI